MDGMHRVTRALTEGRAKIDAVRFTPWWNHTTEAANPMSCRTDTVWHRVITELGCAKKRGR